MNTKAILIALSAAGLVAAGALAIGPNRGPRCEVRLLDGGTATADVVDVPGDEACLRFSRQVRR